MGKDNNSIGGWKRPITPKTDWIRTITIFPLIEAILSLIFGLVFFFILDNKVLAELTWVLGPALSISRHALEKRFEDEFAMLKNLIKYVDVIQSDIGSSFKRIIELYAQISETDFCDIKEGIICDTEDRLAKLAHDKRSDELNTGEYFNWLFRFLSNAKSGSTIWAISMNLDIEWNISQEEDTFLALNLEAAKRKVKVERIFVIPSDSIEEIISNKYVKSQIDSSGEYLIPLFVTKEHLDKVDKKLLSSLGEGIIAVDNRVVLIDTESESGFRGIVTMNQTEISDWHRRFEQLRVYASDIESLKSRKESSTTATTN